MSDWLPTRNAMPPRSIGWSSTARIRMKSGPVFMILFHSPGKNPETTLGREFLIGNRSWDAQLYLRPNAWLTPDLQLRSDLPGSFADTQQAPMPRTPSMFNDACVNAFSIVAEAETKRFAVGDLRLDMPCLAGVEGFP